MNFKKLKDKGIIGSVKGIGHRISKGVNKGAFYFLRLFPIDDNSIVLESEGDLCDNAYALFSYMKENGYLEKYKITWLVESEEYIDEKNVKYASRFLWKKINIKTANALARCRWFIYDHYNVMEDYKKRDNQESVYLSHGWGYKTSKGSIANNEKSRCDYIIVTGELAAKGMATYHDRELSDMRITGYPRLDYFFRNDTEIKKIIYEQWHFDDYKKIIFWMPTFRKCTINENISEEYFCNETGLPIFETEQSLIDFSELLVEKNVLLVLKVHHLQAELPLFNKSINNVIIIRDEELHEKDIQLYQLVKYADCLITDYSSIAIDYLLLDRPIVFTLDDYEEYNKSRGLFPDNAIDFMPGHHVYNQIELENSIVDIINGDDPYAELRQKLTREYHSYVDGNSSKRVLDLAGITI